MKTVVRLGAAILLGLTLLPAAQGAVPLDHFQQTLREGRFAAALQEAQALLQEQPSPTLLDTLSYQLLEAGAKAQSLKLLLPAYPYAGAEPALRVLLIQRLALLAAEQPAALDEATRARLRAPLETPALRGAQAMLFSALHDCASVRTLLGDRSPDYGRDDWLRLGECARDSQPDLAQYAYHAAWQRQRDGVTARALAYQAFATSDYATALAAWHSLAVETLSADDLMAAVTTAVTAGDDASAREWLAAYGRRYGTDNDVYWWRLAQAEAKAHPERARDALQQAIRLHPQVPYYARLAQLQQEAGDSAAAVQSLLAALQLEPQNPALQLQLAYAQENAGDLAAARAQFETVRATHPEYRALSEQLAYVAQQQGDIAATRDYTRQAIDIHEADAGADATQGNTLFGLRRLHEDLGRRWTLSADLWSGAGLVNAGNSPTAGTSYRSYMQLEAEYRLDISALSPRLLAPYVRIFAGSGEENSALPVYSPMLGAGLRLRPWRTQNVALAVEQQLPLDYGPDVQSDLMLRASGSWLDNGRFSNDWHAAGAGWTTQTLYLDAAYFTRAERSAGTADYRLGHHHKLAAGQTLEPYAHLQYNVVASHGSYLEDVRGGIGLHWHRWFGETRYDAWRHKVSVGVEYQHAFNTWLSDEDNVSLNLGLHW